MDNNKYDGKHLSLKDRNTIEQGISQRLHKSKIAELIDKNPSTVAKGFKRNKKLDLATLLIILILVFIYLNVNLVLKDVTSKPLSS